MGNQRADQSSRSRGGDKKTVGHGYMNQSPLDSWSRQMRAETLGVGSSAPQSIKQQAPNALSELMGAAPQTQLAPRVQAPAKQVNPVSTSFEMGTVPALATMLAGMIGQTQQTSPLGLHPGTPYGMGTTQNAPLAVQQPTIREGVVPMVQTNKTAPTVNMPNAQTPSFIDNINTNYSPSSFLEAMNRANPQVGAGFSLANLIERLSNLNKNRTLGSYYTTNQPNAYNGYDTTDFYNDQSKGIGTATGYLDILGAKGRPY